MRTIWRRAAVTAAATAAALAVTAAPALADGPYPVNWDPVTTYFGGAVLNVPPAGADVPCTPDAAHPYPVVLVHGIASDQDTAWQAVAPVLANAGYCVYTLTYGQVSYSGNLGGIDDINTSAAELASFVKRVLAETGASKVDMVVHSEGGIVSRDYIHGYGGQSTIHHWVSFAGLDHGSISQGAIEQVIEGIPGAMAVIDRGCASCEQMTSPSFVAEVDSPPTYPGIGYTTIASTRDELVNPVPVAQLPAAPNVTNEVIQDYCPDDPVGHLGITYDRTAVELMENALDPSRPVPLTCDAGLPA